MVSIMRDKYNVNTTSKVTLSSKMDVFTIVHKMIQFIQKKGEFNITPDTMLSTLTSFLNFDDITYIGTPNAPNIENKYQEDHFLLNNITRFNVGISSEVNKDSFHVFKASNKIFRQYARPLTHRLDGGYDYHYFVLDTSNGIKANREGHMLSARIASYHHSFTYLNATRLFAMERIKTENEDLRTKIIASIENLIARDSEDLVASNQGYIRQFFNEHNLNRAYDHLWVEHIAKTETFGKKLRTAHLRGTKLDISPLGYLMKDLSQSLQYANDQHINRVQTEKYVKKLSASEYATSFMTKKNIPPKIQEEMKQSPFLSDFKFVELDQDTDLTKYARLYPMFQEMKQFMPPLKHPATLRFRKLGNHNAIGIYFPHAHCISIDLRDVSAFVHEYAHAIDFTMSGGNEPLSLHKDFAEIVQKYRENFDELTKDKTGEYYNKRDYYKTPTEIFARGYEIALRFNGHNSPLIVHGERLNTPPYLAFRGLENLIRAYYKGKLKPATRAAA